MRSAQIKRKTRETEIELSLNIDGTGKNEISTKCGFLDHMLELFAKHGRFDMNLFCKGDIEVDYHHTTEDVGIVLGQAFKEALGEKKGIVRYGNMMLPMDEALVLSSLDISGRACVNYQVEVKDKVGDFDTELVEEFLMAFSRELGLTLHVVQFAGINTHHIIEAVFKGLGRALNKAVEVKFGDEIPSTKGVL